MGITSGVQASQYHNTRGFATGDGDTVAVSVRDLLPNITLRYDFIDDTATFRHYLNGLNQTYPNLEDTCSLYLYKTQQIQRMLATLGIPRGNRQWVDSVTYIADYTLYQERLSSLVYMLQQSMSHYRLLEQQRVEQMRRKERVKQQAAQVEASEEIQSLKSAIQMQHSKIENICMASNVGNKSKLKELKDLWYSYLPIYNQYNLAISSPSKRNITQLNELKTFQQHLLDSVLSPLGLPSRIEQFPDQLLTAAGKEHAAVYRSYNKVMRTPRVPIVFNSLDGYNQYIEQLQTITQVQHYYMQTIALRQTIATNGDALQQRCGKHNHDIYSSYQQVVAQLNQIPAFNTVADGEQFIQSLNDFIEVQQQYYVSIDRLNRIQARGDSIQSLSTKGLSNIATAYKTLLAGTDMIPNYHSLKGAQFFHAKLDDFEQLQQDYFAIITLRKVIARLSDSIQHVKDSPKGFSSSYRQLVEHQTMVPNFQQHNEGLVFIQSLNDFIALQRKLLHVTDNYAISNTNDAALQTNTKDLYPNLYKAYLRLKKTYNQEAVYKSAADVDQYLTMQTELLAVQQKISTYIQSPEQAQKADDQLKNEKNVKHIKLLFNL